MGEKWQEGQCGWSMTRDMGTDWSKEWFTGHGI